MTGMMLIVVFLAVAVLMYTGKMPAILALPVLAIVLTMSAGIPWYYSHHAVQAGVWGRLGDAVVASGHLLFYTVINDGVLRLHNAIATVMVGGIFAFFLKTTGVSERLVRKVAELAGDKPFVITLVLTLVVAFLFTTLGGLGAIILLANIYFPVLLSLGVPPLLIGSLFLMALSLGGVFNMVNWALYTDILKLNPSVIMGYALPLGGLYALVLLVFIVIEFKRARLDVPLSAFFKLCAGIAGIIVAVILTQRTGIFAASAVLALKLGYKWLMVVLLVLPLLNRRFSWVAMLAPFVPISLVLFLGWNILSAFVLGIIFLFFTALDRQRAGTVNTVSRMLVQSLVEGIQGVTPAVAIMLGIGMVLVAVVQPVVSDSLTPLITLIIPTSKWFFVVLFTVLSPLALYRGPLNLWGMGSGLMGLLMATGLMPAYQIMAAFMATGQVQGVCDPTNTHNVWVANQLKIEVNAILRRTMPYMLVIVAFGLILGVIK